MVLTVSPLPSLSRGGERSKLGPCTREMDRRGNQYGVSLHGHSEVNQRLVLLLARNVVLVAK